MNHYLDNMEKKNIGFVVVIIVLVIALIGLISYIVYDKILDNKSSNVTVKTKESNADNEKIDIEKVGKELFEKYTAFINDGDEAIYSNKNLNYNNLDNPIRLQMALGLKRI